MQARAVVVVGRVDDNADAYVILRRSANHCGTANIDIFDRIFQGNVRLLDRCFEGIKIHNEKVDGVDAVFGHDVLVSSTPAEKAAVNDRVKGLDPSVHDLREHRPV